MTKAEQKFLVDREGLDHLIAMLRDGLEKGASDRELEQQMWEILDSNYREATDSSLKEKREGRVKRFKNAEDMIKDLETD